MWPSQAPAALPEQPRLLWCERSPRSEVYSNLLQEEEEEEKTGWMKHVQHVQLISSSERRGGCCDIAMRTMTMRGGSSDFAFVFPIDFCSMPPFAHAETTVSADALVLETEATDAADLVPVALHLWDATEPSEELPQWMHTRSVPGVAFELERNLSD